MPALSSIFSQKFKISQGVMPALLSIFGNLIFKIQHLIHFGAKKRRKKSQGVSPTRGKSNYFYPFWAKKSQGVSAAFLSIFAPKNEKKITRGKSSNFMHFGQKKLTKNHKG